MNGDRIAVEHALAHQRWPRVLADLNRKVMVPTLRLSGGTVGKNESSTVTLAGDVEIAKQHGLTVRQNNRGRLMIQIPPVASRVPGTGRSDPRFFDLVRDTVKDLSEGAAPAPVVEQVRSDGRKTYLHNLPNRASQVAIKLLLTPHLERRFPRTCLAYRSGVSREQALYFADRLVVLRNYKYAMRGDIRRFFDNIQAHQVESAVSELLPNATTSMIMFLSNITKAPIVRLANHPEVNAGTAPMNSPARNTILQGSVLGPLLANCVGSIVFGRVFNEIMRGDAVLLLWSDDLLVLGRDAASTMKGMDLIYKLAAAAGFELHSGKTDIIAHDLAVESVTWLGKELSSAGAKTLQKEIDEALARIAGSDPFLPEDRGHFVQLAHSLILDGWTDVGDVATRIYEKCGEEWWLAFDVANFILKNGKRSKRLRRFEAFSKAAIKEAVG